jgi:predicted chitinase
MNVDTLLKAMPGLARARAQTCLPYMETACRKYSITTQARLWMWLAQIGHESVSLRYFEEIASGAAYEGRKDLGNTQPGDGKRFKGRGPIQITGRYNYTAAAKALGLNLVGNPAMAAQPQYAFHVSAWWWGTHGLNTFSDKQDVTGATRRINGGTNGLADRQSRFTRCKNLGGAVLLGPAAPPKPGMPAPAFPYPAGHYIATARKDPRCHSGCFGGGDAGNTRRWQQRMRDRGWSIKPDGCYGPKSLAVCRSFQGDKGLKSDGLVGPKTWAASWTASIT